MSRVVSPYRNAGFFVLRTPLLPYDTLFGASDGLSVPDDATDDERLGAHLARERQRAVEHLARAWRSPLAREALFVASPDLRAALDRWEAGDLGDDAARKVVHALYRYLARMSARSTPFGLFAGVSIGRLTERSDLRLADRARWRRFTALDTSWLVLLFQAIGADPAYRAAATWFPNTGTYRAGGALRFAETTVEHGTTGHRLASIEADPCLDLVLELARDGATLAVLTERLVEACGVGAHEARAYLDDLIDQQLLVSDLAVAVTGPEPLADAADQLAVHPDPELRRSLARVREGLAALDRAPVGAPGSGYDEVLAEVRRLPVEDVDPSRLFHVDLWKELAGDTLGSRVISDVRAVIAQLWAVMPPPPRSELEPLRAEFLRRFGDRWVPLTVAADPELGIVACRAGIASEATAVLDALTFRTPGPPEPWDQPLTPRDRLLLDRLRSAWRRGESELVLGDDDLRRLRSADPPGLPPSFAAWFQLARGDAGDDHEMLFLAAVGPPSSRLLGRFAHGNPRLAELLRELAAREARAEPDAILAEIVHLPEGRTGNVVCRPVIREFEIPYLGRSGAPRPRRIPIDDLWLGVVADRFELRSRRLGRRIVPALSCAHNTDHNTAPLYWLLALLQHQDCCPSVAWSWGALGRLGHLPRVRIGRVIVAREAWVLDRDDLAPLGDRSAAGRWRHLRALRRTHHLPRWVSLTDGDHELPIDLDNPIAADVLAAMVKSRPRARLVELWPGRDRAGVDGPGGRFVNEVVVPFVRAPAPSAGRPVPPPLAVPAAFGPGTAWVGVRLFTHRSEVDRLVLEALAPELATAPVDRWIFAAAPAEGGEWRVTLAVRGDPDRVLAELAPRIGRALEARLADGRVRTWAIEPSPPALLRYGGPPAVEPAQEIRSHDTAAALGLLDVLRSGDEDLRWQLALASTGRLLADLEPDPAVRRAALDRLRAARLRALPVGPDIEAELGRTFRVHADRARQALAEAGALEVLAERSRRIAAPAATLAALHRSGALGCPWPVLLGRLAEDGAQRLLRSAAAAHELVIYDLLSRIVRSDEARAKHAAPAAAKGAP